MSYEEEIVGFLSSPENLRLALDIEEHLKNVKVTLEEKFWKDLLASMGKTFLNNSSAHGVYDWQVVEPVGSNSKNKWPWISLQPKKLIAGQRFFCFTIQKEAGTLYGGIPLRKQNDQNYRESFGPLFMEIPGLKELQDKLRSQNFKTPNDGWLSWKWFDESSESQILSKKNILSLAEGTDYADLMTKILWDMFIENREAVERINKAILEKDGLV